MNIRIDNFFKKINFNSSSSIVNLVGFDSRMKNWLVLDNVDQI